MALVGEVRLGFPPAGSYDDLRRAASPGVARDLAVDLFARAREAPARAGVTLSGAQRELRVLHSRQRGFVIDALYDLVRHQAELAALLGADAPIALWVGWLVRCGLDPDEAAELSGVSADFGRCARWEAELAREVEGKAPRDKLALLGGVDPAVADELLAGFGEAGALAFLEASNRRAPVALRANTLRLGRDELAARLTAAGVVTHPGGWADDCLRLEGRANLVALEAWRDGSFEVQDEGSQLLAALADARGVVVDLCAGAGGKALAMACRRPDRLVACDVREAPLRELHQRAARAGVRVEVHRLGPGGELPAPVRGLRADRVLVDAPCSGTGALRRHPEHRWLVDGDRLAALVAAQSALLDRAAGIVRPGGRLIYGTCSVLPAENELVVAAFLERHPDFAPLSARSVLGATHGEVLRVGPHTHDTDGFFGAVLARREVTASRG